MNAHAGYASPDAVQVRTLLGMLFDGLTVKPGTKLDMSTKAGAFCGVFVADDGAPVALCACDIAFAANSGAALSMLPPNVAREAVKSKELTTIMTANLREVMNICSRLLLRDDTPHLRLEQLCAVSALPASAAAIIPTARNRADFEIALEKYGAGLLSVLSV